MKPQIFKLDAEILEEFRQKMDAALESVLRIMIEKEMVDGCVTGKIDLEMMKKTNQETGEIYYDVELVPNVNMKIGAGGKIECEKKQVLAKTDRNRRVVVASNQISMDEFIRDGEGPKDAEDRSSKRVRR